MSRRIEKGRTEKDLERARFAAAPNSAEGPDSGRRRGREPSRLARLLFWAAGIGSSLLSVSFLSRILENSPLFALERIEVAGTLRASLGELPSLKGVEPEGNLLTLDIQEVVRKLEAQPGIESASVAKKFPNQLVVRVEERQPVALAVVEGELYHVDADGVVFRKVGPGDALNLPVISGLGRSALDFGPRPEGRQMEKALGLLKSLEQDSSVLGGVSEVRVDASQGLIFFLVDLPVPVQIGWDDFDARKAKLERILPLLLDSPDTLLTVDLRFQHQVVVRQAPAAPGLTVRMEGTRALTRLSAVIPDR